MKNWREKYKGNDRAGVLVLVSIMDHALQIALSTHLVDADKQQIFGGRNPALLSTTHAKITLAYHLGVIPDWMSEDLKTLNDIRNAFAHSARPLNFDDAGIAALCGRLSSSKVRSYRQPYLEFLIFQDSWQLWEHRFRRFFAHDPSPPPQARVDEYERLIGLGPPHSEDDRNRFWVICNILFSYLAPEFSEGEPLKYSTSTYYQNVISAAAPL